MFLLIIISQKIYSQVPSYIPTNGLVGYWPFSGNANDLSGNGNNGTVVSGLLSNDRLGNANSSYYLNGQTDYITVPAVSNMFPNRLTLSVWVKIPSNYTGNNGIGPIIRARLFGYILWFDSSNGSIINILHHNSSTTTTTNTQSNINDNKWHQIVVTFDGTNNKLYLDGQMISSVATTSQSNLYYVSDGAVTFGRDGNNSSSATALYQGWIDDIGIWNRALTQSEILEIYNGVTYSNTCNAVSGSLVNGLKAYYPFCGNANDQSGNGLNGTVNGATLTTDRFGNANSAYNFNGINNFISCLPLPISGSSPRSITFWYKQTGTITTGNTAFSWGAATQGNRFDCGVSSGVSVGAAFSAKLFSYNATPTNWNMYTIVLPSMTNPSVNDILVYQNGVLLTNVLTNSSINVLTPINTTANEPLLFGKNNNSTDQAHLLGSLDDIGIWNRALTQQEIMQLYNQNQCINTISVTDTLIINVGQLSYTAPVTFANNITIFPNPASTQININFNNITDLAGGSIKIINSLGQQVATTPITATSTNSTMSLNTWGGAGLYFVQILNTQGQIVDIKKIVLQ